MKNFLKTSFLILLIQSILMGQAFSASRVDDVLISDREHLISDLVNNISDIQNQKMNLEKIEKNLKLNHKGHSIYLQFETIAGAAIAVGIVIGSYKAHFPPGFRAMVGAYVTVTAISRGLIKLNDKEVKLLLNLIVILKQKIKTSEIKLSQHLEQQCRELDYYPLCTY